jgi:hypothetical protein
MDCQEKICYRSNSEFERLALRMLIPDKSMYFFSSTPRPPRGGDAPNRNPAFGLYQFLLLPFSAFPAYYKTSASHNPFPNHGNPDAHDSNAELAGQKVSAAYPDYPHCQRNNNQGVLSVACGAQSKRETISGNPDNDCGDAENEAAGVGYPYGRNRQVKESEKQRHE